MDHRQGVVMEIKGKKAIILTTDGEFIQRQFTGALPQVGEEVTLGSNRSNLLIWGRWAVAAVLLLLFLTPPAVRTITNVAGGFEVATAYVTVDINPSVELAVDRKDRVVDAKALNDDGKQLLQDLSLQGSLVKETIIALVEKAGKDGYLPENSMATVLVAVVNNGGSKTQMKRLFGAGEEAQRVLQDRVRIQTVQAGKKQRVQAGDMGLSTGKYAVLLEALDEGLDITPADLQGGSVTKVITHAGGNPGKILDQAHAEKDLEGKAKQLEYKLEVMLEKLKASESENGNKASGAPGQIKKGNNEGQDQQSQEELNKTGEKDNGKTKTIPESVYDSDEQGNKNNSAKNSTPAPAAGKENQSSIPDKIGINSDQAINGNDHKQEDKDKAVNGM
ncbi:MAG: anti-sigma factor domain-containing protein [Bacillota bacterium]